MEERKTRGQSEGFMWVFGMFSAGLLTAFAGFLGRVTAVDVGHLAYRLTAESRTSGLQTWVHCQLLARSLP